MSEEGWTQLGSEPAKMSRCTTTEQLCVGESEDRDREDLGFRRDEWIDGFPIIDLEWIVDPLVLDSTAEDLRLKDKRDVGVHVALIIHPVTSGPGSQWLPLVLWLMPAHL